jgi:hypothetical protein
MQAVRHYGLHTIYEVATRCILILILVDRKYQNGYLSELEPLKNWIVLIGLRRQFFVSKK